MGDVETNGTSDLVQTFNFNPATPTLVEEVLAQEARAPSNRTLEDMLKIRMWNDDEYEKGRQGGEPADPFATSVDPVARASWLDATDVFAVAAADAEASQELVRLKGVFRPEAKAACADALTAILDRDWEDVPHLVRWRNSEYVLELRFAVDGLASTIPLETYMNRFAQCYVTILGRHALRPSSSSALWGAQSDNWMTYCLAFDTQSTYRKNRLQPDAGPARPSRLSRVAGAASDSFVDRPAPRQSTIEAERRAAEEEETRQQARAALKQARPAFGALVLGRRGGRRGVKVERVKEGMAAADAGIRIGDIIHEVNHTVVDTVEDFARIVAAVFPGEEASVLFERRGVKHEIPVMFGAADMTLQEVQDLRMIAGADWCEQQRRRSKARTHIPQPPAVAPIGLRAPRRVQP